MYPGHNLADIEESSRAELTFFLYSGLDRVLPPSTDGVRFVNSDIVDVRCGRQRYLTYPLEVRLAHRGTSLAAPQCLAWDPATLSWRDTGCRVHETNGTHTTCFCHNLGTIALLAPLDATGVELEENMAAVLGVLLAVI